MAKKWKPVWHECKCGNWFRRTGSMFYPGQCEVCVPVDYRAEVKRVSKINQVHLPMIGKVGFAYSFGEDGFQVDHIVPVWFGEYAGIPPYGLSVVENMQIISAKDNDFRGKHSKGWLLPEKWFAYITGKNWVYSLSGSYFESYSLFEVCEYAGVSYVKAASQLMKGMAERILVGDKVIVRQVNSTVTV